MNKIITKSNYSKHIAEEFFRFHLIWRASSRFMYYVISVLCIAIAVVFLTLLFSPSLASIFLILGIGILIIMPYQAKKIAKKIVEENPVSSAEYQVIIDENHVVYKLDKSSKEYSWSDIKVVCKAANKLYFYVTKNIAIIVPLYTIEISEQANLLAFLKKQKKYRKYPFKSKYEES